MKNFLTISLLIIVQTLLSQDIGYRWVNGVDNYNQNIFGTEGDSNGNVYTLGNFQGWLRFNNSTSEIKFLNTQGGIMFLQKVDSLGNTIWAKTIGISNSTSSSLVGVNSTSDAFGNIYITGLISGDIDFENYGTVSAPSSVRNNTFILKMDTLGSLDWINIFEKWEIANYPEVIATDSSSVYFTCNYQGSLIQYGNPIPLGISNHSTDCMVVKMDSKGGILWTKSFGGGGSDIISSIDLDVNEDLVLVGSYSEKIVFDIGINQVTKEKANDGSAFLLKIDKDGKTKLINTYSSSLEFRNVNIDEHSNIYISGELWGEFKYKGKALLSTDYEDDVFILKTDSLGALLFAHKFGNEEDNYNSDLLVSKNNGVFLSGVFTDEIDVNPREDLELLNSYDLADHFIIQLDYEGDLISKSLFPTPINVSAFFFKEGKDSSVYVGSSSRYSLSSFTYSEAAQSSVSAAVSAEKSSVVSKLISENVILSSNHTLDEISVSIYPNPTQSQLSISETGTLTIYSADGIEMFQQTVEGGSQVNVADWSNGIYFVRLINEAGEFTTSFVKQ